MSSGCIAVDLDGTLAIYDHWRGVDHIGEPVLPMVNLVRQWLYEGKDVRIFTARVSEGQHAIIPIQQWCLKMFNQVLPVTNVKDTHMMILFDDRCITVEKNTGQFLTKGENIC